MHSDLHNTIQLYYSRERLISPGVCKQVLSFHGSIMSSGKKILAMKWVKGRDGEHPSKLSWMFASLVSQ